MKKLILTASNANAIKLYTGFVEPPQQKAALMSPLFLKKILP